MIAASTLKGYATPVMLWRFLRDGAAALQNAGAEGHAYGPITLEKVHVADDAFVFGPSDGSGDAVQDVWQLAAAAFTLATGFVLFDGRPQKAGTPVPRLRQPEELGELLQRCLSFDPAARPAAAEIESLAQKELEALAAQPRPARVRTTERKGSGSEWDRWWPEAFCVLVLGLFLFVTPARAQAVPDAQTGRLISVSLSLRQGGSSVWDSATKALYGDRDALTLMDELVDARNDCPLLPTRLPCFGINRIINDIKSGDMVQTTGKDFKDGADPRFGYALIEKGIRAGSKAVYYLKGRTGEQVFYIIPHEPSQAFRFAAVVGGKRYEAIKGTDGLVSLTIPSDAGLHQDYLFSLELENAGGKDASFILINDKRGNR